MKNELIIYKNKNIKIGYLSYFMTKLNSKEKNKPNNNIKSIKLGKKLYNKVSFYLINKTK